MTNLWSTNHPRSFWQCQPDFTDEIWNEAIRLALPILALPDEPEDIESLLELTLGEGQFGPDHWTLTKARRIYYFLKPLVPRAFTRILRQSLQRRQKSGFALGWPVEDRYARFQFKILENLHSLTGQHSIQYCPFWPKGMTFAFVLTHDIETNDGQKFVGCIADLEENLGFHSSFNFVPQGYQVDMGLVKELHQRGFEVGIHGLKHDGRLFNSNKEFMHCAEKINSYLEIFEAVGFRAPLMIRNPEWLQALNIEYDLSFFDTDPFEPLPGGTMSIWPFFIGHFVELPYTLVQDYTLTAVLGESTPRLWLEKVDFIEKYHGMALVNSHPDYLQNPSSLKIYADFLNAMKCRSGFWHALPREIAQWWKIRTTSGSPGLYEKEMGETTIPRMEGELIGG